MSERTAAIAQLYELIDREPEISGRLLVDVELEPSTRAAACSTRAPAVAVAERAVATGPPEAEISGGPPRRRRRRRTRMSFVDDLRRGQR